VVDAGARGRRKPGGRRRHAAGRERNRSRGGADEEAAAVDAAVISSRDDPTQEDTNMARASQKDLLSRLADAGEAAIKSLGDAPGADRFVNAATAMRDRLDELQRRVRGLEGLEQRLTELEKKVDRLAKASGSGTTTTTRRTTARKTTATKSTGAPAAQRGSSAKKS
jgi:hypothetical protein